MKLLFAALLSLPSAGKAGFVSYPAVLTVHGLNPAAISCDPASIQNFAHNEACYAAASLFSKMADGDFDDSYLDVSIRGLCKDNCSKITPFRWGGDIKTSRAAVDRLKDEILTQSADARLKGAPFIIISHSWGTVLAAEALAELESEGAAADLRVDKLVTLGSPLGANAYSLAINGLISGQRFYRTPRRASSVQKWENYYTGLDAISSPIPFADANIRIDADPKYANAERRLGELLLLGGTPGFEEKAALASDDLQNFSIAGGTLLWHAAYYTLHYVPLKSLDETMVIDAADTFSPEYFQY